MHIQRILTLLIITCTLIVSVKELALADQKPTQSITHISDQKPYKGPKDFFTGNVTVQPLADPKYPDAPFSAAYVTFEAGARSNWHTHPTGQHLIVTEGIGRTGTIDGKIKEFRTGDVLWCPAGVKHWHGAAPDHSMTHITLTGTTAEGKNAEWLEPVTDEHYLGTKSTLAK